MGMPQNPLPVKFIAGIISKDSSLIQKAQSILLKKFGRTDYVSPVLDFDKTDYYEKEFGKDLKRQFISFKKLLHADQLFKIKLYTNKIEETFTSGNLNRRINIDPGYVTLSKLVLATTKNFAHRIYVGCGIFEEITLAFKKDSFRACRWTYPDYRSSTHIRIFNEIRRIYRLQLEKKYGLSQLYRSV